MPPLPQKIFGLAAALAIALPAHSIHAQAKDGSPPPEEETGGSSAAKPRDSGLGGQSSVGGQIEEDEEIRRNRHALPAFDRALRPWFDWKKRISQELGLDLGVDYTALYQGASASLTENDDAASGSLRAFGRWTAVGRDTKDTGTLVFKVENRHRLGTAIAPADLGFEVGYLGITGLLFNDLGTLLTDLHWQQRLADDKVGLIVGRLDPSDFMDLSGYANPWTTFQNLAVLLNTSIALPDVGMGLGAGRWLGSQERWNVSGLVGDANGVVDEIGFFDDGSEFFSKAAVRWMPSREERYLKATNLMIWHVDQRVRAGVPESEGVAFSGNWTFGERWMPFLRLGWSQGDAPLASRAATTGFIRRFLKRRDLFGFGIDWSDPPDPSQREQTTLESFYRIQFAQNLALTPSLQLLVHPSLNPETDKIWVFGLRLRSTL